MIILTTSLPQTLAHAIIAIHWPGHHLIKHLATAFDLSRPRLNSSGGLRSHALRDP